jgi:septum formation protein
MRSIRSVNLSGKKIMASNKKYQLVLASNSPRRKELLGWIDVPFTIQGSDVEEVSDAKDPVAFALDIAKLKGESVWQQIDKSINPLIVASDTLVELNGKILGKPASRGEAQSMLEELAGQWHRVVTSVFIRAEVGGHIKDRTFAVETRVKFGDIPKDIMVPYLDSKESMDKAGAYGIQGKGLTFVEALEGSYSNVVGFPLYEFINHLKDFLPLSGEGDHWREFFQC